MYVALEWESALHWGRGWSGMEWYGIYGSSSYNYRTKKRLQNILYSFTSTTTAHLNVLINYSPLSSRVPIMRLPDPHPPPSRISTVWRYEDSYRNHNDCKKSVQVIKSLPGKPEPPSSWLRMVTELTEEVIRALL